MTPDPVPCVCEATDSHCSAVLPARGRFEPSGRSLLSAAGVVGVGLLLALLEVLPQPERPLAAGGLAATAIAIVIVSGVAGMRRRDATCNLACQVRELTGELAEREEVLRQVQTDVVEQHRRLLEQMGEHERDSERLRYLAHFDSLTGLPNRWLFLERLERAIADARAQGFDLAVLTVDIDGLRKINGSLGHHAGDKVLETMASRLQQTLRPHDTVARWAGDEFLIILPRLAGTTDVDVAARKLLAAIAVPLEIHGCVLNITGTIGIAVFPGHGIEGESLVQHAASALHHAKREGTNRFARYSSATASAIPSPFLESGLHRAIERSEFVLYYQPIVQLGPQRVTGVEALIRWEHPQLGTLLPACFLGLAEELGVIVPLSTWAVREACAQVARWDAQDLRIGRLAVNISAHQLREPNFSDLITDIAGEAGIDPERIELELTETVLVADDHHSVDTLRSLKRRGFRIAIDDFGTGYSSLSYLQRLPIDRLKIDRAFVRDLGASEQSAAIAELIIAVARRLGLRVTAEGVETASQLELLLAHGCDEFQGYYFGKPGPPPVIASAMRARDLEAVEEWIPCTTTS